MKIIKWNPWTCSYDQYLNPGPVRRFFRRNYQFDPLEYKWWWVVVFWVPAVIILTPFNILLWLALGSRGRR